MPRGRLGRLLRAVSAGRWRDEGGPTKEEVWRAAARRLDGSFHPARGARHDAIVVPVDPWRVVVDLEVVNRGLAPTLTTRAQALYRGRRELTLDLRRRRRLDGWWAALTGRAPPPLNPALLDRYRIRGRPRARLASVFSPALVEALLGLPPARFEIRRAPVRARRRLGEGIGMVRCRVPGVVTDEDALVAAGRSVRAALEALRRVSEADGRPLEEEDGPRRSEAWS